MKWGLLCLFAAFLYPAVGGGSSQRIFFFFPEHIFIHNTGRGGGFLCFSKVFLLQMSQSSSEQRSGQSGRTALRPSAHRVLPLAVARSRCPGPEFNTWAHWERIPLDILSNNLLFKDFHSLHQPSVGLLPAAKSSSLSPCTTGWDDLNEQKFIPFSCWLGYLQSIPKGFILIWQNWSNVAGRPPHPRYWGVPK